MNVETLRARGELLNEALGRESYEAGAGLKAESDFAGIFERYADLASDEAWEVARRHSGLAEWVADARIGRAVAALDDRMHAWVRASLWDRRWRWNPHFHTARRKQRRIRDLRAC